MQQTLSFFVPWPMPRTLRILLRRRLSWLLLLLTVWLLCSGDALALPLADRFITAERFQQVFRGTAVPYLNAVETTTDYWNLGDHIEADQVTAVYLAPQDPNFLAALGQPVALYRYRLHLLPRFANTPE
jgi:hypothetical protein